MQHVPTVALLPIVMMVGCVPLADSDAPAHATAGRLEFAPPAARPESDVAPSAVARFVADDGTRWPLHGGAPVKWAVLDQGSGHAATVDIHGTLERARPDSGEAHVVAHAVVEAPVFDPGGTGRLLVANATAAGEGNALWIATPAAGGEDVLVLAEAGAHNERACFSPDGTRVAFVSDRTGLPSVFVVAASGGPAIQLTNVDVVRTAGRRPEGYIPPPVQGRLQWNETGITYLSPEGLVTLDPDPGR